MDATDLHDPLLTCPYDKSHRILKSRMQYHLVRCRKNHPCDKSEMETCPYDATHIISKAEFPYHLENCFKRGTVVNFITSKEPNRSVGAVSMDTIINVYVPPQNENWDNEPPEQTYDALKEVKNKCVSIPQVGYLSKAKRKLHIQAERLRIRNLETSDADQFNPPPRNRRQNEEEEEEEDVTETTEAPLRPPRSKVHSASICSNTDYMAESLNNTRQLNSTFHSECNEPAIPIHQNASQAFFKPMVADTEERTYASISQSSINSIKLFNPAPNEVAADEVNDINFGNLHISTAYSSTSTLNNIDSNICPLDNNNSVTSNHSNLNSSKSDIMEIQKRLDVVTKLQEHLDSEKAILKEMVNNLCSTNDNDSRMSSNSRCAANFSNASDMK
ncbi:uncharacterized protein LOC122508279 [Leptopilina heterotoma]|uniref:uncharacterized protein LOC122508279 n=1 Tax=Leptopilina heterotoma TaxID=63436 RepID=UPI001CA883B3|nr:uncharacterized protein LOC122508279 [Leptopilina heterotoma]